MRKLILSVVISIMHFSNSYSQGAVSTIGQAHNTALETYYKKYGDGEPIDIVTVTKRLYQINKQSDPIHFEAFTESDLES